MSRIKLKQILSNLHYDENLDQLILSSSKVPLNYNPDFIVSGSIMVTPGVYSSGSLTIKDIDTFGDSSSFDTMDLGEY